jgi:hypothetical protein
MTLSCLGKGCAVGFSVGLDGRRYRTAEGQLPPEMAHAGRVGGRDLRVPASIRPCTISSWPAERRSPHGSDYGRHLTWKTGQALLRLPPQIETHALLPIG